MAKQNYIVDMQALYECLQFLPQMRVNGDNMVSLNDVLNFLDHFPKTPTVLKIVLDEDSFEADEPLKYPCYSCEIGWGNATAVSCTSCHDYCEKLKEYRKKAEV